MARDDDSDDKNTAKAGSKKASADASKPVAKAKDNAGASKPAESKKVDAAAEKPAADKAAKKVKEGKAKEAVADKAARVEAKPVKATSAPAHEAGHAHAHGHHAPNRKEYWKIFGVLFVLTVIEVAVAQVPGISKAMLVIALVGLAIAKAACVALFYMHLKHETRVLRAYVAIPFAAPAVYALVLIAEAAWRLTR